MPFKFVFLLYAANEAYECHKLDFLMKHDIWCQNCVKALDLSILPHIFLEKFDIYRLGPIGIQGPYRVRLYLHSSFIRRYTQGVEHSQINTNKAFEMLCFSFTAVVPWAYANMLFVIHYGRIVQRLDQGSYSFVITREFQEKGWLADFS